jgi:hypothetical protein
MGNYKEVSISDLKLKLNEVQLAMHEMMMRIENLEKKINGTDSTT